MSALALACGSRSGLLAGGEQPVFGHAGTQANGGAEALAGSQSLGGKPAHAGNATGGKPSAPSGAPSAGEATIGGVGGVGGDGLGGEAGAADPAPTEVVWGKSFGDSSSDQEARAIAVEPNGVFTLTGSTSDKVDFGSAPLNCATARSVFLAQFEGSSAPLWSACYGQSGYQDGLGIDVAEDGTLSVVGRLGGSADFGGGLLPGTIGASDAFIASLDHDGKYRFAKIFGNGAEQSANAVAVTAAGQPVVVGEFVGNIELGGGLLAADGRDAWLGSFSQQGAHRWSQRAGDLLAQEANGIARSNFDDGLFVVGGFMGTLKLGACSTLGGQTNIDNNDIWLAWLTSTGDCLKTARFGDGAEQTAAAVATGKGLSNAIAVVGSFTGTIDIGGASVKANGIDAFVALLSADSSTNSLVPAWVHRIGSQGSDWARGVTIDANDNVIVVGDYVGEDAELGLRAGPSERAAFAVKYDTFGKVVWAKSFGGDGAQIAYAVGADEQGYAYVAGSFEGRMPLSSGTLKSAGKEDIFVVKLAP